MRAAAVVLTEEQGATLRGWLVAGKTEQRLAFRAGVILAIAEGLSNQAVAERVGTRPATVSKWRGRFARAGVSGLRDALRSGKPRQYEGDHERRILAALDEPPRGCQLFCVSRGRDTLYVVEGITDHGTSDQGRAH
jgi:hypothetical protein